MFVDILSDTHFDSWFGYPYKGESDPKSFPPKEKVLSANTIVKERPVTKVYMTITNKIGRITTTTGVETPRIEEKKERIADTTEEPQAKYDDI